jgi:hypothetical protein
MHIYNTMQYWCAGVFNCLSLSLSVSVPDSPFQGLAHLKAEQGMLTLSLFLFSRSAVLSLARVVVVLCMRVFVSVVGRVGEGCGFAVGKCLLAP